jgi:P-type Ca2+ transporter type 2C
MGEVYPAWCHPIEDVLKYHGTNITEGLTDEQVAQKLERYGFNELEKQPGKPLWRLVLEQFDDMLVKVIKLNPT